MMERRKFLKIIGAAVTALAVPMPLTAAPRLSARQNAMKAAAQHLGVNVARAREKFIRNRQIWAGWIWRLHNDGVSIGNMSSLGQPAGYIAEVIIPAIRRGETVWNLEPIALPRGEQ